MAREKLDAADFHGTKIVVSGDLNIEKLLALKEKGAPIDGWGVGTHLSTLYEQPSLDMVYKLSAIQKDTIWHYKLKYSESNKKTSDPGILGVKRYVKDGLWLRDVIYHLADASAEPEDILTPVFRKGTLVYAQPSILETRAYCLKQVNIFHASCDGEYPVSRDPVLLKLKKQRMKSA